MKTCIHIKGNSEDNMRILVVDDAAFLRMTLRKILENHGHTIVGEACDGYEAIQEYQKLKPDLVTMDITMPHMSGMDALKEIIKLDNTANIMVCSAMGRNDFVIEALKSGAKGFITKPFNETQIVTEINRIDVV